MPPVPATDPSTAEHRAVPAKTPMSRGCTAMSPLPHKDGEMWNAAGSVAHELCRA